jgi:hypothetical protein
MRRGGDGVITNITLDTRVTLFDVDQKTFAETECWSGSIAEFLACNEFDSDEQAALLRDLADERGRMFGGGAEALTVLRALHCRYCKEAMERRITRNRYTRTAAPGDVCGLCLKDDAIDYAGVERIA